LKARAKTRAPRGKVGSRAQGRGSRRAPPRTRLPADFRLLIDSSPLMIWLSDVENQCIYFNRRWLEFTGRSLGEELGAGWLAGVHPDDRESCRQDDQRGFDSRLEFRLEYRLRRHDGIYRWILDQCTPRHDTRGRFIGYLGSCTDVTELRETAADATRWQRRYEAALQASGWVSYELDRSAHRMLWSAGIEKLIGYPPQWLTDPAGWMNHVHPDDRERLHRDLDAIETDAPARALHYRVRHRDGAYLWLEDRVAAVREAGTARFVGFVSDVTEHVRREEHLRRSDERFRLATDVVNGIVYSHDLDTDRIEFSGRLIEELGLGARDQPIDGAAWLRVVHPEDRGRVRGLVERGQRTAQPLDASFRLITRGGAVLHVYGRMQVVRDEAGTARRVIGFLVDVSGMRLAEEALRLSEERFRRAAEAVDGIVYEIDVRSGAVARTGRLLQRLGYGDSLAGTGEAWLDLVHPEDREALRQRFAALLAGSDATAQSEYRLCDAGGTYHHVLDRHLVMRDDAGGPLRVVGCSLDISALKRAQQQVLDLNADLEQRVADRTAALRAANQELEAFTYSVSHDLRAPLRHVAGFADLLRSRLAGADATAQRYLDTVITATMRMAEMIDKLLALSRVGRGEMHPASVDLGELVAEVREELTPTLDGRNVEWHVGALPVVRGDRALLRGALQNLLDNALKFSAGRAPAVIEVSSREDTREHEIVVRDNGAGFDMKYASKLFGVFQRLHGPGEFEGTGIGLASVRRIISRHGGRVWAEGNPGQGAVFHFTLPAREEQQ
jgi:PAS domain S-box-containing protein